MTKIIKMLWKRRKMLESCKKKHANTQIGKTHNAELKKTENNNMYKEFINYEEENG